MDGQTPIMLIFFLISELRIVNCSIEYEVQEDSVEMEKFCRNGNQRNENEWPCDVIVCTF